jgi:hypothetical protein
MIFLFIRMDLAKDNPALRAFDKPIRLLFLTTRPSPENSGIRAPKAAMDAFA